MPENPSLRWSASLSLPEGIPGRSWVLIHMQTFPQRARNLSMEESAMIQGNPNGERVQHGDYSAKQISSG